MKNDKMGPVQGFKFGGIANPTQRATLRPSDRAYLEARQRELDAYERQRLAYNKALEEYQSKDQTEEFRMAAPVLPFKEADVAARQQQAAERARRDAGNRAVAIDVVSDPKKFGFSSFALSDRFMAKGGEVRGYAEGGEVDEDDDGVGEVGSAAQLLAQLEGQGPRSEKKKAAPALKRMATGRREGSSMPKAMEMSPQSLTSTRELVAMATDKGTAKEQMQELARLYQLRAATFNQPTLTEQTLSKGPLAAKRFKEGGEAKKPEAEVAEPSLLGVTRYATQASARMFPDQAGQDDQRDAARHMLAAGTVARKYGPNAAKLLGLAHEYGSNPQTFFSALGIGEPRDDLPYDVHNNRIGAELAARATSQEDLERLVKAMALQAMTEQTKDKPYIMSQEKMDARAAKAAKGPTPRPQGYQEGGEAMDPYAQMMQDAPRERVSPLQFGRGLLDTGAGMLKGSVQAAAGLPGDIESLGRMLAGSKSETVLPTTDDTKKFIDRFAPLNLPADPGTDGRTAAEYFGEFASPAAATGPLVRGAQAVGSGVMEGARQAEKALDAPVTRIMERGGRAADLLESFAAQPSRVVPSTPAPTPAPTGSVKTPAPASELGFYSAAEQAALNLPRKEGTGAAFLNDLMKAPDVKKEELSAMGLDEFLKSKPKATRQEVQDFIANNRLDVKEVQLGGKMDFANLSDDQLQKEYVRVRGYAPEDGYGDLMSREEIIDELSGVPAADLTKFSQYQLPGGDNYREILLTIPGKKPQPVTSADDPRVRIEGSEAQGWEVLVDGKTVQSYKPGVKESNVRDYVLADANYAIERQAVRNQYRSPHFSEPNILAHLRVNDRVDADGKKMLLIEELQSDWHQTGREKGYNTPQKRVEEQKKLDTLLAQRQQLLERRTQLEELASPYTSQNKDAPRDIVDEWNSVSNQLNRLQTEQNRLGRDFGDTGVPDAPFKDTWHQLALKRALKYAADNGYDRVGLTTGKQQAQRYDLSKQVDNIAATKMKDGSYTLLIERSDGGDPINRRGVSESGLEDLVGKELSQKIMSETSGDKKSAYLEGLDLQVGGEGMKKYYDEIYPGFLAKQAKKYGSQVGETSINVATEDKMASKLRGRGYDPETVTLQEILSDHNGRTPSWLTEEDALVLDLGVPLTSKGVQKEPIRYIDITPGMKGAVPYAKGGPVDKNTAFIKAHS